jgi:hypothetical protein
MANQRLWAVGNATGLNANLTSTNGNQDSAKLPLGGITHTGGQNGDYIQIPDCSGSQWYDGHHILIQANDHSWTVSVWSNDEQNGQLYWSPADAYYDGNPLPGSGADWNGTLLIQRNGTNLSVGWAPF